MLPVAPLNEEEHTQSFSLISNIDQREQFEIAFCSPVLELSTMDQQNLLDLDSDVDINAQVFQGACMHAVKTTLYFSVSIIRSRPNETSTTVHSLSAPKIPNLRAMILLRSMSRTSIN